MSAAFLECGNCGKFLPPATSFCDYCGNPARGRPRQTSTSRRTTGGRKERLLQRAATSGAFLALAAAAVAVTYFSVLGMAALNQDNRQPAIAGPAPAPAPAARAEPAADLNLQVQKHLHRMVPHDLARDKYVAAVRTLPDGLLLTTSPELAQAPAGVKASAHSGPRTQGHEKIGGDQATGASWLEKPQPWDGTGMRVTPAGALSAGDRVFNISLTPGNAVTTTPGTVIEAKDRIVSVRLDNRKREEHGILVTESGCLAGVDIPASQDPGGAYPNITRAVAPSVLPPLAGKADPSCAAETTAPGQQPG